MNRGLKTGIGLAAIAGGALLIVGWRRRTDFSEEDQEVYCLETCPAIWPPEACADYCAGDRSVRLDMKEAYCDTHPDEAICPGSSAYERWKSGLREYVILRPTQEETEEREAAARASAAWNATQGNTSALRRRAGQVANVISARWSIPSSIALEYVQLYANRGFDFWGMQIGTWRLPSKDEFPGGQVAARAREQQLERSGTLRKPKTWNDWREAKAAGAARWRNLTASQRTNMFDDWTSLSGKSSPTSYVGKRYWLDGGPEMLAFIADWPAR